MQTKVQFEIQIVQVEPRVQVDHNNKKRNKQAGRCQNQDGCSSETERGQIRVAHEAQAHAACYRFYVRQNSFIILSIIIWSYLIGLKLIIKSNGAKSFSITLKSDGRHGPNKTLGIHVIAALDETEQK